MNFPDVQLSPGLAQISILSRLKCKESSCERVIVILDKSVRLCAQKSELPLEGFVKKYRFGTSVCRQISVLLSDVTRIR